MAAATRDASLRFTPAGRCGHLLPARSRTGFRPLAAPAEQPCPSWLASGPALLSALVILAHAPTSSAAELLAGAARVIDGDTLYVQGQRIRLYGVDAPEKAQQCRDARGAEYLCGQRSLQALEQKLDGRPVVCSVMRHDMYGRSVASCALQELVGQQDVGQQDVGQWDVGAWLVSNGYAVAYRQYSKEYVPLEEQAHAAGKGIWQGSFEMPAQWRKDQKAGGGGGGGSGGSVVAPSPLAQVLMASEPWQAPGPAAPASSHKPAAAISNAPGALSSPAPAASLSSRQCSSSSLPIKGNISRAKERVYHMPGGASYDQVKIDEGAGERYFCSEQEAQAAGWRAAAR